jgi:sec-independent protein translocase protein TatA
MNVGVGNAARIGKEAFMKPLIFNLGPTELLIILAIVLLLFGGSRLAGLGKSTGRALKEFKEETKGLKGAEHEQNPGLGSSTTNPYATGSDAPYPPQQDQTPRQQGQTPYQQGQTPYQDGPAQPYQQGPTQPSGDGTPYQQPPQQGGPGDRDVRRDV